MNIKNILKIILIFILSGLLFYCNDKDAEKTKAPGIVNGDIITIKSKTSGTINSVNFIEGKKIIKGVLLLNIDQRIMENKLAEIPINLKNISIAIEDIKNKREYAVANKKYLSKQIDRFKRLLKSKSISGEKLENFQLKLKMVKTEINGFLQKINSLNVDKEKLLNKKQYLNLLLEDYTINSPVEGVIIEKFISPGENIFPGKAIADILDLESLYIEVFLEGEEISRLKLGDSVKIFLDGIKNPFNGNVSFFGRKAEFSPKYVISEKERKSLLYLVKIKVIKNKDFYKVGMPVTVIF